MGGQGEGVEERTFRGKADVRRGEKRREGMKRRGEKGRAEIEETQSE